MTQPAVVYSGVVSGVRIPRRGTMSPRAIATDGWAWIQP